MIALAIIAVLAVALLFGGMVFFAAGVAPVAFRALPAEAAGRFIRAVFPVYYLYVFATAAAGAVAMLPLSELDAAILAVVAGITLWLRQVLMPRLNALSDLAKQGDTAAARAFANGHRISVGINLLQMLAAAAVLARFAA